MKYYSYNESKEYLKSFNIRSSFQFYRMVKHGSFIDKINKRPYEFFTRKKRNSWISWSDFLSFEGSEKYLKFEEARDYISHLHIKSHKEWINWCKINDIKSMKIPSNPQIIYKNIGWISMSDWLGNKSYKNSRNIKYISYDECKYYIKSNFPEIKNKECWIKFNKERLPLNIPKRPDYFYKKTNDWMGWDLFLGSELSPRNKGREFLSFQEAKIFLSKLKFKDRYEFSNYLNLNNINFIPKRPDYFYKDDWIGYIDFLGCANNRESIGERLIKSYLDENKIKYEKEKYFESCKSLKKLPFDFYLPENNICIEYDGEFHYKSIDHMGGDERLSKQKRNDDIKDKWCIENGIKLIRISYLKKNKINKILNELFIL